MALVTTAIVLTPFFQPFSGTSFAARQGSSIPRGLRVFNAHEVAVDAKPVNDTQLLTISAVLPLDFAYVLMEISARLTQDVAFDWHTRPTFDILNPLPGVVGTNIQAWPMLLEDGLTDTQGEQWTLRLQNVAPFVKALPMWNANDAAGATSRIVRLAAHNTTAAVGAAGTLSATMVFLEYDLEQARNFPLNWAIPTRP